MNPTIRTALLAAAVLVLVGIGAVLVWTQTEPVAPNLNTPSGNGGNVNAAPDPVGTPVTASLRLGDGTLEVVKSFRTTRFRIAEAGAGMEFIVVQFQPLPVGGPSLDDAAASVTLTAGGESYGPRFIELVTAENPDGIGSLAFPVPIGAADPTLVLPGGATLALPV